MTPSRPRVLVTLPDVAWPLDGGKRLRCAGVVRALSDIAEVDVAVLFAPTTYRGPVLPPEATVHSVVESRPPAMNKAHAALAALRYRVPVHVSAQRWGIVRSDLAGLLGRSYDLAWLGGLDHSWGLRQQVKAGHVIVDCDDVETEKWRTYLRHRPVGDGRLDRLQRRLELPLWARLQRSAVRNSDAVAVCSELDRARLGSPTNAFVLPNTYPEPGPVRRNPSTPPVFLMVANFTTEQNVDAAEFVVSEILPKLGAALPAARLRLVGRGRERIDHLSGADNLDIVGHVDDVAPELEQATAVVVPMRFGGGTRLKILEAFAYRVPVVSTSLGCEGIAAADGEQLLVRDDPEAIAAACREISESPERAEELSTAAYELYHHMYRPEAAMRVIRDEVDRLLG